MATYANYCIATGLMISDCITQRQAAADWIKNILKATNSEAVFSQGLLTVVPYGDQTITSGTNFTISETHVIPGVANPNLPSGIVRVAIAPPGTYVSDGGVVYSDTLVALALQGSLAAVNAAGKYFHSGTDYYFYIADANKSVTMTYIYAAAATYTAPSAPVYALTDDDLLIQGDVKSAITVTRTRQSDQINNIKVEYFDRSNNYNPAVVELMDDAAIMLYGRRSGDTRQSHFFCSGSAAQQSANLELGRQYIRSVYTFTLGAKYILLDPMDIVSIQDGALFGFTAGVANVQWVRIREIKENPDLTLTITAEEYLAGTGANPTYAPAIPGGFNINFNVQPGSVNTSGIHRTDDRSGGIAGIMGRGVRREYAELGRLRRLAFAGRRRHQSKSDLRLYRHADRA